MTVTAWFGESSGSGGNTFYDNLSYTSSLEIPEPASLSLLAVGALAGLRRKRRS